MRLFGTGIAYTMLAEEYRQMLHDLEGYAMMPLALALVVGELWVLARLTTPPEQTQSVVIARQRPRHVPDS